MYALYVGEGVAQKHICVYKRRRASLDFVHTAQKMKFSIKNFFCNCDKICRKLRIWSHLLEKSLTENFIFCDILHGRPVMVRGHTKSTFVQDGRGGVIEKRTKKKREGECLSMCVRSLFKKNAEIFKMKFYSYSPVFPIDYNDSMKY